MSQYKPPPPTLGQGGDLLFSFSKKGPNPHYLGLDLLYKNPKIPPPLGLVNEDEYDSSHLKQEKNKQSPARPLSQGLLGNFQDGHHTSVGYYC